MCSLLIFDRKKLIQVYTDIVIALNICGCDTVQGFTVQEHMQVFAFVTYYSHFKPVRHHNTTMFFNILFSFFPRAGSLQQHINQITHAGIPIGNSHGFMGYPKGQNIERALAPQPSAF